MKVVILYEPDSETDTPVQQYVREFEMQTGKKLELLDSRKPEAVALAKVHDILQFPAILATENDGGYLQSWTELEKWPTISELSYYTQ